MAVQGTRLAQCMQQGWKQHRPSWDIMNEHQLSEALVGLHSIEHAKTEPMLTIAAPPSSEIQIEEPLDDKLPAISIPNLSHRLRQLPGMAAHFVLEFIKNPVLIIILTGLLVTYQQQVRAWVGRLSGDKRIAHYISGSTVPDETEMIRTHKAHDEKVPELPVADVVVEVPHQTAEELKINGESVADNEASATPQPIPLIKTEEPTPAPSPEKKKGKAHRGRRGGVKHKKGKNANQDGSQQQDTSQDGNPPKPKPTVEDAVRDAQKLGEQTKLEPDIRTISNDPSEVSGPIIRIGALEVNTEKLIGTGSNGTMVFEGNFDGRDVAVKRMLMQFFDIASQETKLLRESDDHPNGKFIKPSLLIHDTNLSHSHSILRPTTGSRISLYCPRIMSSLPG